MTSAEIMRTTKQLSPLKTNYASDVSCYHFIPVFPNFWAVRAYVCIIICDWDRNRVSLYVRNINWIVVPTKLVDVCILSTRVCASVLKFLLINHWTNLDIAGYYVKWITVVERVQFWFVWVSRNKFTRYVGLVSRLWYSLLQRLV